VINVNPNPCGILTKAGKLFVHKYSQCALSFPVGFLDLWDSLFAQGPNCSPSRVYKLFRYVRQRKTPNDLAQRRGRNAKKNSSSLIRVRCSALLGFSVCLASCTVKEYAYTISNQEVHYGA
jgi:hypothetical protein